MAINRVAKHPSTSGIVYVVATEHRRKTVQRAANPGGVPERPKGADCKSAGSAFPGSNPGAATRERRAP
ncbi:hypothetical protein SAM23877_4450 [Streptomyces ambofaciens ATCC 23877]|uniref:Uncharacterized protein n=1 Tax=Streptomyces ambofaciens (strain ATCC 23877 / 3486 / DSM 40053 / JCM 4204 / NBRC 12836 / NRRL B-2516) TaxID=278992 RepID=A0A0K2AWJ4_STRA7|nr:hypothetical protein SAM23877_4450 [Streptomyces ambofaciens ATCC 23877]